MLEKVKTKFILLAILIAVITGIVTGGTVWMCENGKCMCKKAKKCIKKMTEEL